MKRILLSAVLIALVISIGSCSISPTVRSFKTGDGTQKFTDPRYDFANWVDSVDVTHRTPDVILVSLSGGGVRASALAAATLEELRKFTVNGAPLTNDIAIISSTSGGSIASGYIAAHGFDHYDSFRDVFLSKNNTRSLVLSSLRPAIFYDRSALMESFLSKRLGLSGLTLNDISQKKTLPYFVFNATDVSGGHAFRFTQRDFDLICSNPNDVPLSTAITASAAIPFLLTDVELRNNWDHCNLHSPYAELPPFYTSAEEAKDLRYDYNLIHAYDDAKQLPGRQRPKFLHLMDGGLADNAGVRALVDELDIDNMSSLADRLTHLGQSHIRQVLVLEVNARSDAPRTALNSGPGSPSLLGMTDIVTGIPIDQSTELSTRYMLNRWSSSIEGGAYVSNGIFHAEIDFDLLPDSQEALRSQVKSIGMGLTLKKSDLEAIEKAASILLRQNKCFARFVSQSGAVAENYTLPPMNGSMGVPFDCWGVNEAPM